ncbi:MAG TPA: hypothetical protein VM659_13675 [Dongiaceae bacterium]|nr:hypothetical protein [Dongiaceae bacterium]
MAQQTHADIRFEWNVAPPDRAGNCSGIFFNQINLIGAHSEDPGHRDTKPIGGMFFEVDRSADDLSPDTRTRHDTHGEITRTLTAGRLGAVYEARYTAAEMGWLWGGEHEASRYPTTHVPVDDDPVGAAGTRNAQQVLPNTP